MVVYTNCSYQHTMYKYTLFRPFTDYDAPLTEAGDYSEKYFAAKTLIAKYNLNVPNVAMPTAPAETTKTAYPTISATQHLTLNDLVLQVVILFEGNFE